MSEPATETLSVVVEREIAFPPEKVWRALTQPHLIEEWLMKNDFKPVGGHRFNFRSTPVPGWNGVIDGEVLAAGAAHAHHRPGVHDRDGVARDPQRPQHRRRNPPRL